MTDLTEIGFEGQFATCIREYFTQEKPKNILETGLYHGMGSTRVIASLIRDMPIYSSVFFSIECNSHNINVAKENLREGQLLPYVTIVSGLSIPRDLLPTAEEINKRIELAASSLGVKLDHEQDPKNGANYYQKETEKFERDDRIGDILAILDGKLDFALLDSGGHIGKIEFEYLIGNLEYPCAIALDDTRHVKHFESYQIIKNDRRFIILNDNEEKYGSILTKFNPL